MVYYLACVKYLANTFFCSLNTPYKTCSTEFEPLKYFKF